MLSSGRSNHLAPGVAVLTAQLFTQARTSSRRLVDPDCASFCSVMSTQDPM
jgi:hypothetical protein